MPKSNRPKVDRKARMKMPPVPTPERPAEERVQDFDEILVLYGLEEARLEASRCLQCPTAPCQKACPIHNDIPAALWLLERSDVAGAAEVYRRTSTLPEICGMLCPQTFCQDACVLTKAGKPINTRRLETFINAYDAEHGGMPLPEKAPATGKKVAVVGSGPAGLTVAEQLTIAGHAVVVYDRFPKPGGLLLYGIPNFKLDKKRVERKIAWLEALGVEFRCGVEVGKDLPFEQLQAEYDAIFLGMGAHRPVVPRIPGVELKGVHLALEFLSRANLPFDILPPEWQEEKPFGPRVHVLGGGDTAMDCIRTAVRLPSVKEATCYYRRSEAEMPAHAEDYRHALEEGGSFVWQASPVRFLGDEEGRLKAVVYQRMELGEPDKSGRRRPVPVPNSEFTVEADDVVLALGFRPDRSVLEKITGLELESWGSPKVESQETGRTSIPGLFAAGDLVRGASLVAPSVADARHVAEAMDAYLRGEA